MKWFTNAQKKLTKSILRRKLEKEGKSVSEEELERQVDQFITEANRTLKEAGSQVLDNIKEVARDTLKRGKKDQK